MCDRLPLLSPLYGRIGRWIDVVGTLAVHDEVRLAIAIEVTRTRRIISFTPRKHTHSIVAASTASALPAMNILKARIAAQMRDPLSGRRTKDGEVGKLIAIEVAAHRYIAWQSPELRNEHARIIARRDHPRHRRRSIDGEVAEAVAVIIGGYLAKGSAVHDKTSRLTPHRQVEDAAPLRDHGKTDVLAEDLEVDDARWRRCWRLG